MFRYYFFNCHTNLMAQLLLQAALKQTKPKLLVPENKKTNSTVNACMGNQNLAQVSESYLGLA